MATPQSRRNRTPAKATRIAPEQPPRKDSKDIQCAEINRQEFEGESPSSGKV